MRKLPPLNSLKAFEVSARYKNFTRAASELGVTQGAISKQIGILEDYLGVKLFKRRHRNIELTKGAAVYASAVRKAIESIENATEKMLANSESETLRINVMPSLTSRWLIPKMEDFKKKYPNISVLLDTGDGNIDFDKTGADIAIRVSRKPKWKCYAEKIMGEELLPVCAPSLKISKPQDLVKYQLLQHTTRPDMWNDYLRSIGHAGMKVKHEMGFEHFFMLTQAAVDGLGVALIPRFLIERELKNKSLRIAFVAEYKSPYNNYFLCPKPNLELKKVRIFRQWLLSQA